MTLFWHFGIPLIFHWFVMVKSRNITRSPASFADETNFVTYSGKCMAASPEADRYVVHLETACGEAKHYCALFKQRDANVMEFQLGEF